MQESELRIPPPPTDLLAALQDMVPEAFDEGRLDMARLRRALGDDRFGLRWAGKAEALRAAQRPAEGALLPAPEESVGFEEAAHLFLEGDNLEVLKRLLSGYHQRVKLIYVDPPYNTGHDFVYRDDFAAPLDAYMRQSGQADAAGNRIMSDAETGGRVHAAWLSMMLPRLALARRLLRPDGVIFVSIDDHEVAHLRLLMDEVFGPENFVSMLTWRKKVVRGRGARHVIPQTEYVLVYARDMERLPPFSEPLTDAMRAAYTASDERGPYKLIPLAKSGTSQSPRPNLLYPIEAPDGTMIPCPTHQWRWSKETLEANREEVVFRKNRAGGWSVFTKQRLYLEGEERERTPTSYYDRATTTDGTEDLKALFGRVVHDFPKPVRMVQDFVTWATGPDEGALVLDFFAGSGTTGQAVLAQNAEDGGNRRFVLVQLPEPTGDARYPTIAEVAKERLRKAGGSFRVFKLGGSAFKPWRAEGDLAAALEDSVEALRPEREPLSVVFELAQAEGLPLTARVEEVALAGCRFYEVEGGSLLVCLEREVAPAAWEAALARRPRTLVACESAFAGAEAERANMTIEARRHGVAFRTV